MFFSTANDSVTSIFKQNDIVTIETKKETKKKMKEKEQYENRQRFRQEIFENLEYFHVSYVCVCVCVCDAWLNCEKWSTYKLYHSPVNVHPCRIFSDETDIACRRITCCIVLETMRMHCINNWSCMCAYVCVNAIHVGRVRTRFAISLSRVHITNRAQN